MFHWLLFPLTQVYYKRITKNNPLLLISQLRVTTRRCKKSMHSSRIIDNGDKAGDVVLVTGGAGFLGQHIVSQLQTRANHVGEIRVLDLKPYKNKLGKTIALLPRVHLFIVQTFYLRDFRPGYT